MPALPPLTMAGNGLLTFILGLDWMLQKGTNRGPRVLNPLALAPKSTRKREVILVSSEYPVQPGTGKRSPERLLKPNRHQK